MEQLPRDLFRPRPAIYWIDLLVSASLGWAALAGAIASSGLERALLLVGSIVFLYRATLFIHEMTHLAPSDVAWFKPAWNVLVGIPVLLPSFLYEGVHLDHHRHQCYGTVRDPEYVPFARRPPTHMLSFLIGSLALPIVLVLRFGVLAPVSWFVPAVRRFIAERCSSLAINHQYVRRAALGRTGLVQEIACTTLVWGVATMWVFGVASTTMIACWIVMSGVASGVNAMRTLAAHRYRHDATELTVVEQLLDSCTIAPARPWSALWAPVGLRYHALHHWIPSLPYHSLGRAHRLLAATLPPDAPYRATTGITIPGAIADLVQRASRT